MTGAQRDRNAVEEIPRSTNGATWEREPREAPAARRGAGDEFTGNIQRRGLLKCMAWAGTGLLWGIRSGMPVSWGLGEAQAAGPRGFSFLQVSDSHIGFDKPPNADARATFREAVAKIQALPQRPAFILHTGDISHLSREQEWDDADQILGAARLPVFHIPGEHDMLDDENGKAYLRRYGQKARGAGWYSFDAHGIHFVALVNVANLKAGGMGSLGPEQLEWLERDLKGRSASTPLVVFAHIPLWVLYPQWGWGTEDGARALSYTRRFGSVTVLNGHIHQVMQKEEGNVAFYTARSTAFPQPAPGSAPSPGSMKVPAEQLQGMLGIRSVSFVQGTQRLAIVDSSLAEGGSATGAAGMAATGGAAADGGAGAKRGADAEGGAAGGGQVRAAGQAGAVSAQTVRIDNFTFGPPTVTVPVGGTVTWLNSDDIPHTVVAQDKSFRSKTLDSQDSFSFTFVKAGQVGYFCSLHPHMTGTVIVHS